MAKDVSILPLEVVSILPHEAVFASWGKIKYTVLYGRIRTGSDWWFSKILRIRTVLDSTFADQDWSRTEKFHSPLMSGMCW